MAIPKLCQQGALQLSHLGCLGSLIALFFDEANSVAFAQGLESFAFNGTMVHKYILATVSLNKTVAFAVIEPLYSTFRHVVEPLLLV
jgi:hypothetical protein